MMTKLSLQFVLVIDDEEKVDDTLYVRNVWLAPVGEPHEKSEYHHCQIWRYDDRDEVVVDYGKGQGSSDNMSKLVADEVEKLYPNREIRVSRYGIDYT